MHKGLSEADRTRLVSKVIDDMTALPKARACVEASSLYNQQSLTAIKDPLLKRELCAALAQFFAGSTASALQFWQDQAS